MQLGMKNNGKSGVSPFHIVASTGRTATTFIAQSLDTLPGITGLHEGHKGRGETKTAMLPLINLENLGCYKRPQTAHQLIANKRNQDQIQDVLDKTHSHTLVDVAYYNPTIAYGLLDAWENLQLIGIIRDCESFVRSAARLNGEDIMAVGWPDPQKPLTSREKFIAMGRIRPGKSSSDHENWPNWGTIERNIWLWHETNQLLLNVKTQYPDRVHLIAFEVLQKNPENFWRKLLSAINFETSDEVIAKLVNSQGDKNKKQSGYQIGPSNEWTDQQRQMLNHAKQHIEKFWREVDDDN